MISDEVIELQKYFYQTNNYLEDSKTDKTLILGIGNYIMGDEGVGVHAIHKLSKIDLPDNVDIIDGGTGSFNLMPIIARYSEVIFIDATMDNKPVGTVDVLYPKFSSDFPKTLSVHDVGLKDMLDALEFNDELPKIKLITVTINDMRPMTIDLSEKIEASLPIVVEKVLDLIK